MAKRTELGTKPRCVCACGWKAPVAIAWDHEVVAIVVSQVSYMVMICPQCFEELTFPLLSAPVEVPVDPAN